CRLRAEIHPRRHCLRHPARDTGCTLYAQRGDHGMKRLMIVRHGESEWNADRRLQGQADIALSPKGRSQAQALIPVIAGLNPDRTICSDLERAHDTAKLLGIADADCLTELREINVGDWTGRPIEDIRTSESAAYQGWRA